MLPKCSTIEILPAETLILIAAMVDKRTCLVRLCQVNSRLNSLLLPLLYNEVLVFDPSVPGVNASIFINTVLTSPRAPGSLIQMLSMCSAPIHGSYSPPSDFTMALRDALLGMPNLRSLGLTYTCPTLDTLFADSKMPFQLDKLWLSSALPLSVLRFLETQPRVTSIITHELEDTANADILTNPEMLPSLRHVDAAPSLLGLIIPGRPVSDIVVYLCDSKDIYDFSALNLSRVPITSLEYQVSGSVWSNWERHMSQLHSLGISSTLRRLVVKSFDTRSWIESIDTENVQPYAAALANFHQLKELKIDAPTWELDMDKVTDWLKPMSTIIAWRKVVPSLRIVEMLGLVIR